jgi:hypothetical protein
VPLIDLLPNDLSVIVSDGPVSFSHLTATVNGVATNLITGASYAPAGQLSYLQGAWGTEGRRYNAMLQLTFLSSQNVAGAGGLAVNKRYDYSATQNNGKITDEYDYVSGETVTYSYDYLGHLAGVICLDRRVRRRGRSIITATFG